jgi:hypothetical protein
MFNKTGVIKNGFNQNIRFQKEQDQASYMKEGRNRLGVELPCSMNLPDCFQSHFAGCELRPEKSSSVLFMASEGTLTGIHSTMILGIMTMLINRS